MASIKTWLSSPKANRSPLLSDPNHELPRWRSPSPMSSSVIPPPIVQSTYALPPEAATQSVLVEKISPFEERQQEIQADLQFLLDAQAEGLVRGFGSNSRGEQSSTGSTTPTAHSARSASNRRVRRPFRKQIGLRSARKGILNSIMTLSSLKDEELRDIDEHIQDDTATLRKITTWEKKRTGLQEASQQTESEEDNVRIQRLRQEADVLQIDINKTELHLMEMKSRQRKLLRQATAVENSVQAKIATYTSSLRSLDEDIQEFLRSKPENLTSSSVTPAMTPSVWELPPKRRDLSMVKEFWDEQCKIRQHQRRSLQQEHTALLEGAHLWKDAITELAEYEKQVRAEMSTSSASISSEPSPWEDSAAPEDKLAGPKRMLSIIGRTLSSLEEKHSVAERRNWNLLIAALGAEIDALLRAKQILDEVIGSDGDDKVDVDNKSERPDSPGEEAAIYEADGTFQVAQRPSLTAEASDTEDEPSPELMFSHQDTR